MNTFFEDIIHFINGLFSYNDKVESQPDSSVYYDNIWDQVMNEIVACNIPESSYEEAELILYNQQQLIEREFNFSEDEEAVIAILTADVLSKLVVWDICSVQAIVEDPPMVEIPNLVNYSVANPIVDPLRYKLHRTISAMSYDDIDEDVLELIGSEIAIEINDFILELMFSRLGNVRTITPTLENIDHEIIEFKERLKNDPTWMICSQQVCTTLVGEVDLEDPSVSFRGHIYNTGKSYKGMQVLMFANVSRTQYMYMGASYGEQNIISPLYFAPKHLLVLDGPIPSKTSDDLFLLASEFATVGHEDRKIMVRKFNIKED